MILMERSVVCHFCERGHFGAAYCKIKKSRKIRLANRRKTTNGGNVNISRYVLPCDKSCTGQVTCVKSLIIGQWFWLRSKYHNLCAASYASIYPVYARIHMYTYVQVQLYYFACIHFI